MTNKLIPSAADAPEAPATRKGGITPQLGERDVSLLCDLLSHGAMLAEHVQALYFPGRSRRRMNQRLRQLRAAGLVMRRPLPLGLGGALPGAAASYGIPWVYSLGAAAAPLVAGRLEWDVGEVRRLVRAGTPTAAAHALEVVGLRLRAEQDVRQRNARTGTDLEPGSTVTLRFLPERLIRHDYDIRAPGGEWREESYRPDALLQLGFGDGPWRHFFAEVDLGHTSSAGWWKKADIAARYRRAGLFRRRYGSEDFRTLVCTTGERRRGHLCRLLARRLDPDAACFGVATLADIAKRGLLAPIWHVPGAATPLSLEDWSG